MARPREFDEDKALDAALQLFWEKGYEAVSLSDLTSAMNIQRPSIYAAFGNKQGLFEAALRKYTQTHSFNARAKLQHHESAKEAFRSYFEDLVAGEYGNGPNRGCFCLNTMVELAPHDKKMEILTREHQMYLAALFQETIERGIRTGEFESGTNAQALAQTLVVALIGLTVMMKSRPERAFADNAVRTLLALLK
ncbi:TetR/AcrR family transcriptional regulator [Paenibacillus nasutitermitis]|uniref:TetR family transcriptional regulator n=1 Tax=Paenibacillus nasutitermitis TaxID=1652958 RepID=A0A916Z9V7_9BACL|nr:TetR/AcrR family transcriptional regulator [Paenibacillus nasutitermitis]GGD81650.1 TetR family transcriptional regulator [Paenibacillus nasutitermitis]